MAVVYPAQDPTTYETYGDYMVIGVFSENNRQVFITEVIQAANSKSAVLIFKNNNSWRTFSSVHVLPPAK